MSPLYAKKEARTEKARMESAIVRGAQGPGDIRADEKDAGGVSLEGVAGMRSATLTMRAAPSGPWTGRAARRAEHCRGCRGRWG